MCEISFIKRIGEKCNDFDVEQLVNLLEVGCKDGNKDGFGVFNNERIFKKDKDFKKSNYKKDIIDNFVNSDFLVGHNRFKTNGEVSYENTHPFENERFIWCHNGVIQNDDELAEEIKAECSVDSMIIGTLLLHYAKDKLNVERYIKKVCNELKGSVSCFIYDKLTKRLFYVRYSSGFAFRLIVDKNDNYIIIGNTYDENLNNVYNDGRNILGFFRISKYKTLSHFIPQENILYEITDKGFEKVCEVNIEKREIKNDYWVKDGFGNYHGFRGSEELEDLDNIYDLTEDNCEEVLREYFGTDIELEDFSKNVSEIKTTNEQIIDDFNKYYDSFLFKDCKEVDREDKLLIRKKDLIQLCNELVDEMVIDGTDTKLSFMDTDSMTDKSLGC